jgi:hypothetical protein
VTLADPGKMETGRMSTPSDIDPPSHAEATREMLRRALRPVVTETVVPASAIAAGKPRPRRLLWISAVVAVLVLAGIASRQVRFSNAPAPAASVMPDLPLADEPALLAAPAGGLQVFRLQPAPRIVVLIFPSLRSQGLTLNRIGAFVEKAGVPHDHVLGDAALAGAIAASHDTIETYYYGHDYRAADLARFFVTAGADGISLNPEEIALHGLLQHEGLLSPGAVGAIITLPPPSDQALLDASARAAILRHEISHGLYFTDPAYAAYVGHFWQDVMDGRQRAAFRRFLGDEGYDTANEDLISNETQAYLVHTPDQRFFTAAAVGMSGPDVAALRQKFVDGMPASWLRARTPGATRERPE